MSRPSAPFRWTAAALALVLAACGGKKNIDEGEKIGQINAGSEKPEKVAPPVQAPPTRRVSGDAERAMQNYEKLLDLPQDPASRAETMRRLADLQLEQEETNPGSMEQTERRLKRSIELYETLLRENPNAPGNDRILYQMSRAYQNLGENDKAEEVLNRMTREFPDSSFNNDAHFRRAELLFKLGDFEKAGVEYRYILDRVGPDSPFFEPAQYKYGWTQYKISNYGPALDTFFAILDRELPPGELVDEKTAIDGVRAGKKDTVKDAIRVICLSFSSLGGGESVKKYFSTRTEPGYAPLIYDRLAETLLEKKRFTDAARAYSAFVSTHPTHRLAPGFQNKAIAAQQSGGFVDMVVEEKEQYITKFDPASKYWSGRTPTPEIMRTLRENLAELGRHYQAQGQKAKQTGQAEAPALFLKATERYGRLLELFPQDPEAAELRFLMAESFLEAGQPQKAAQEYDTVATKYPADKRGPEAAYAAVLAYERHASEVAPGQKKAAQQDSIQAALKFGTRYPNHEQANAVLTRAAEELYVIESWDEAVKVAGRVINASPPAPVELRRTSWGVTADAHFSAKRYAQAEAAYQQLLALTDKNAPNRGEISERLASCIYKQGEAARTANDPAAAAAAFLRVGTAVPDASIRATATYDGAAMLIAAKQWAQAATVLEGFRKSFPTSPLLGDVDDKLAVAYKNAGQLTQAAAVQKRIAGAGALNAGERSDAAWEALQLLETAKSPQLAAEYESYLKQFPQPLDRAMEARNRLAELAFQRNDPRKREHWLREIINADAAAGAARTPRSQQLAAEASLEFALKDVEKVSAVPLKLPLKTSLPKRKAAMETAINSLTRAADYGIASVTTAATFELGRLYQEFSTAILQSDRPARLSQLEAEQYTLLLEEQAFPFEEKAIEIHTRNLERANQGVTNEWVGRSLVALEKLAPGQFGKRELTPPSYDPLHAVTGEKDERYDKAVELVRSGSWEKAEIAMNAWAKKFPQYSGPLTNLGIIYARTNRKAEALDAFTRAAQLNPQNAVAYTGLGILAAERNDFAGAERAYRQALAADRTYGLAHLNLGILYDRNLNRAEAALQEYKLYMEYGGKDDYRAALWVAELEKQVGSRRGAPTPAGQPGS